MLIHERSHDRPVDWGPYPLEVLAQDKSLIQLESCRPRIATPISSEATSPLGIIADRYTSYFSEFLDGDVAPVVAPVPDDLARRSQDIKGAAYYMDAAHAGICQFPENAWYLDSDHLDHPYALALLIEVGRAPELDNLAHDWLVDAETHLAYTRACEIAATLAGYIRQLGFSARAHIPNRSLVDLDRLAVLAGIAERHGESIRSPFIESRFVVAVVTTDYELAIDFPIKSGSRISNFRYWWGINGATSGRERSRRLKRPTHASQYPMERVKRVDRPTTLIFDDEVPRVPKRANFFTRATFGDLNDKAQREVKRFAFKHPLAAGMMHPLRSLVPWQDGNINAIKSSEFADPKHNSKAIKSLAYHLGADLVGICEIPDYAWYSHDSSGKPIKPYHQFAIVMLIDQGHGTMEGASGDDWISACQSMGGYLRGAEIAGIMAEFLRDKGLPAKSQTNADSDVLQIPLVLWSGLGELSRIGELVLNPYVGPRFKSVVVTTDLALESDKPIDFGLQYFCQNCLKCARECPVNSISFTDKIVFNGYEIWKPDVERCTRYRLTNQKGASCGRCMKTCPLNKVVSADGSLIHRIGTYLGIKARWLKPLLVPIAVYLDDRLGYGKRNLIKKWWFDLEVVDGIVRKPKATNERDLDLDKDTSGDKSPVGYYPANTMPSPDADGPVLANHRQAIQRGKDIESVPEAVQRRKIGGSKPIQYIPTVTID